MKTAISRLLGACVLTLAMGHGMAADSDPAPATVDKLSAARARVADKQWAAAINELKSVNDTGSADWNNLMGYSLRKAAPPDYAAAEKFYDEALRINPKHRGALEYSGELYLATGSLQKAEQRLSALDKACLFGCPEYKDLKQAIERYKAAGNRYVAAP